MIGVLSLYRVRFTSRGTCVNTVGQGLKPPLLLGWLSPGVLMGWPTATSIVYVKSFDVISNLFLP